MNHILSYTFPLLLSLNCFGQKNEQIIRSSDTSMVEVFTEGKGTVFLKKTPKKPGKYIVLSNNTDKVLMEFEINKDGKFCGKMVKYELYSNRIFSKKNYGKCKP